jgi:signal transduction histidine kinase
VLPIGSRVSQSAADKALKERLVRQVKASQEASQAAVEADSALQAALEKVKELSDELEAVKADNIRLRAQLQSIQNGIYVPVDE